MPPRFKFQAVAEPLKLHLAFWALLVLPGLVFLAYLPQIGASFSFIRVVFDAGRFPELPWSQRVPILAESLWIILLSVLIFAVTLTAGSRVRKWLGLEIADRWVRLAFDLGLGIFCLGLYWLGTGLNGLWFQPLWAVMGFLLLAAVVLEWIKAVLRRGALKINYSGKGIFPTEMISALGGWPYFLLLFCGAFYFLFAFINGLVPETFYDSLMYHLAIPADWLSRHGICDFPFNLNANFPYGAELYYLNGLVSQGTETAKTLHVLCLGAAAFLAAGWAKQLAGEKAGKLTLGLCLTFPLFNLNAWTTQVEGVLALFILLFFYSLQQALQGNFGRSRWVVLTGLFAGAALSVKYTAVLGLAAGFLAAIGIQLFSPPKRQDAKKSLFFNKGQKKTIFKHGLNLFEDFRHSLVSWRLGGELYVWGLMFLAALIGAGPWLLKNFTYTGNPFFPYLAEWFSGRHLAPGAYANLLAEEKDVPMSGLFSWLTVLWRMVMAPPDDYNFVGPLALSLVPLIFFFRLKHPALKFLALSCAAYLVLGLGTTRLFRFFSPIFFLFYVLAGAAFGGARREAWGKGVAVLGILAAVLCFFNLAALNSSYYLCAGVWSGRESREDFMVQDKITPYFPMAQWVSSHLPSEARLLITGDSRGLYYGRPFISQSLYDEPLMVKFAKEEKDPAAIGHRLKELGVDYLVVNAEEGVRAANDGFPYGLTSLEWKKLDDFFRQGLEPIYYQGFQAVYQIRQTPNEGRGYFVENPLLFCSAPAARFAKDNGNGSLLQTESDLQEVLSLYDFSPFWWERMARVEGQLGKKAEEYESFEKADTLGPLHPENYKRWMEAAKEAGNPGRAAYIEREARKWYPQLFQNLKN